MRWPPFSPDLNLIESVWREMKDFIAVRYPDLEVRLERSYEGLRWIALDAWDPIESDYLKTPIRSMAARFQAVIDADGDAIKYRLLYWVSDYPCLLLSSFFYKKAYFAI